MTGTFRSLNGYNYRLWAGGAIVSNVGTWMQRTAQDWIVLTQLTHNNATAVGVVIALQFGPQVLFLPLTGYAADHLDRRKLLIATQSAMGLLALGLGILTSPGSSNCGTCTCLRYCWGASRRSMHQHARPSSRIWWSKLTCRTQSH
jgi:MFS family permease